MACSKKNCCCTEDGNPNSGFSTAISFRYPKKRLGQHFLTSPGIAKKIVDSADIGCDDTVLEIGPGKGVLTEYLVEKARIVLAVELDDELCSYLSERFSNRSNFKLFNDDILRADIDDILRSLDSRIIVVSNMPYNISTPIIEKLIEKRSRISRAVLMMQREVAQRLTAAPGNRDYGLTTLNLRLCAFTKKVMDVKPGSFFPPPEVTSTVLRIEFSEGLNYPLANQELFRNLTGAVFRQRRKMLRNTLVPFIESMEIQSTDFKKVCEKFGDLFEKRPETLTMEQFVEICNMVHEFLPDKTARRKR